MLTFSILNVGCYVVHVCRELSVIIILCYPFDMVIIMQLKGQVKTIVIVLVFKFHKLCA